MRKYYRTGYYGEKVFVSPFKNFLLNFKQLLVEIRNALF